MYFLFHRYKECARNVTWNLGPNRFIHFSGFRVRTIVTRQMLHKQMLHWQMIAFWSKLGQLQLSLVNADIEVVWWGVGWWGGGDRCNKFHFNPNLNYFRLNFGWVWVLTKLSPLSLEKYKTMTSFLTLSDKV